MPQFSVMFARFPFRATDHPDTTDWLVETVLKCKADSRISNVFHSRFDDTPITMTRNQAVDRAMKVGADYLVMIDNDMRPDCEPDGLRFWDTSWEFLMQHQGPCMIGAPYCGPPPISNVYVFRWSCWQNRRDVPDKDARLEQFSREEAARLCGIGPVDALPTGLVIIDMKAFDSLTPPYFDYEWTNKRQIEKGSTEDVMMTRNLKLAGVPLYCNWDAWAGHWKNYLVRKPKLMTIDDMGEQFMDAISKGYRKDERVKDVVPID